MQFDQIVQGRRSVKSYDPEHQISDRELAAIFAKVLLTPSSFNLQHWRFVVVRDQALKTRLRAAAFNQEQVEKAAAVVVVLGKLNAHEDGPRIYADAPDPLRRALLPMIEQSYADQPARQRDEAIRSGSLAAMTLMYAAYDLGYASGPMIGFDPGQVTRLIGADEHHIPVMLVVLGKPAGQPHPRPTRLPLSELVKLEAWGGQGLG
ncbi:MAG TPA: nitroreductase family protein [Phycisphaerae bacterium]|nr:nitroreductase family protein [Phycisphaerae bacterium]HNU45147.1 nitroreductase family protein [Phycisphaerae bacterium]